MATAAAVALGLTSAVGFYGATAEEKAKTKANGCPDTSGLEGQLDEEQKRAAESARKAARLEQELATLKQKVIDVQKKTGSAMEAEDAFRRATPQVLENAANKLINYLNPTNERVKSALLAPSKSLLNRGTIWQNYRLASTVEGAPQQGGSDDPVGVDAPVVIAPPPAPSNPASVADSRSRSSSVVDSVDGEPGPDIPVKDQPTIADIPPKVLEEESTPPPVTLPAVGQPPNVGGPTTIPIHSLDYEAFAALWLQYIKEANGEVSGLKAQKKAEEAAEATRREEETKAELLRNTRMSLLKEVAVAEERLPELNLRFEKLEEGARRTNAKNAQDALGQTLQKAKDILAAIDRSEWQREWKDVAKEVKASLAAYESAIKRPLTLSERLGITKPAPAAPLFTGTVDTTTPPPPSSDEGEPPAPGPAVGPTPDVGGPSPPPEVPTPIKTIDTLIRPTLTILTPEEVNKFRQTFDRLKKKSQLKLQLNLIRRKSPEERAAYIRGLLASRAVPAPPAVTNEELDKKLEDAMAGLLTPEERAQAAAIAEGPVSAAVPTPVTIAPPPAPTASTEPPGPPPSLAFGRNFPTSVSALPTGLTEEEGKEMYDIQKQAEQEALAKEDPLRLLRQKTRKEFGQLKRGGMRKRTLKKRRGVNKRNV